jgi:hypothetical protein
VRIGVDMPLRVTRTLRWMAKAGPWLALCTLLVAALVIRVLYVKPISSHEAATVLSPGGNFAAVLIAIPRDANDSSSYKVCLRRAGATGVPSALSCPEIAYLAGVSGNGVLRGVMLVWVSATELEINYEVAKYVHMYRSAYFSGTSRSVSGIPVLIEAVQMGGHSNAAAQ